MFDNIQNAQLRQLVMLQAQAARNNGFPQVLIGQDVGIMEAYLQPPSPGITETEQLLLLGDDE